MQIPDVADQSQTFDIHIVYLGAATGLCAGAVLGSIFMVLLGGMTEVAVIALIHTMVAMMLMGAWSAPALLEQQEGN